MENIFIFRSFQTSEGGEIESKALMNLKVSRKLFKFSKKFYRKIRGEKHRKSLQDTVFHRKMSLGLWGFSHQIIS